jgi:hypothetical protein
LAPFSFCASFMRVLSDHAFSRIYGSGPFGEFWDPVEHC